MLAQSAPFPHPGSTAYCRGTGDAVRILRRGADGACMVEILPPPHMTAPQRFDWARRGASRTTRIPAEDLYPTQDAALHCGRKARLPRRRSAR